MLPENFNYKAQAAVPPKSSSDLPKSSKKADKVASIQAAFKRIKEIDQEAKRLEEEKDALKLSLQELIPAGEVIANVKHVQIVSNSVSYAKYAAALIEKMVPKTKQGLAEELKKEYQSETISHRFNEVK